MRQPPAETPHARPNGRLPPHGGDLLVGWDEELGQIFRNMRLTMQVSRETIARRLATSTSTIENFEAGAINALPTWKETGRIVRRYCEFARIDPEPILWRIRGHLQAMERQPKALAAAPAAATPNTGPGPRSRPRSERLEPKPPRGRRGVRVLFALSAPLALAVAVVYLAQAAPHSAYQAISLLPASLESAARAGVDYVVLLSAPRRDGLRWIDVSDPRTRKTNKLVPGAP